MPSVNKTSQGLMNYGHFTSSKRSMDLDEPIYLNLFTVAIEASDLPKGLGANNDDINIILEGVRSIQGLTTQPGVGTQVQKYKHAERGFAGGAPSQTHLLITMNFELNLRRDKDTDDNYTYKFLRKWHDLIYDPQTGRMAIKKNYVCERMVVTMQDKEGIPYWQWTLHNVFPAAGLPEPALSYDSGNIMTPIAVQFWVDYFDETIV